MDYIGLTRWQSIGRDLSALDREDVAEVRICTRGRFSLD